MFLPDDACPSFALMSFFQMKTNGLLHPRHNSTFTELSCTKVTDSDNRSFRVQNQGHYSLSVIFNCLVYFDFEHTQCPHIPI